MEHYLFAYVLYLLAATIQARRIRRKRLQKAAAKPARVRQWARHPLNKARDEKGEFATTYEDLRQYDDKFFNYTRMSQAQFDNLHERCKGELNDRRQTCHTIPSKSRLLMTLRFLATGDQPSSIALNYRIGKSTLLKIVSETCDILWRVLGPEYLPVPNRGDLARIADEFWTKWNFPNCVGAVDGKHIEIFCPPNTGSEHFNYKKTFSSVLMAACDANYCFTYVDIGYPGGLSDGGVFRNSNFGQDLLHNRIPAPAPAPLPGSASQVPVPFCFVADEAFALRDNMMKPYSKAAVTGNRKNRIFNYRLSRARRIIENAFGILAARWRIFHKSINAAEENVINYVKGAVILHNFIMKTKHLAHKSRAFSYIPTDMGDTEEENDKWLAAAQGPNLQPVNMNVARNYPATAAAVRQEFTDFFSEPAGSVPWQDAYIEQNRI